MPRCLQDVFDVLHKRLKNVHSTSSRRLHSIFETSCKDVLNTSSKRFQDVFKMHDNVKLFLLIRRIQLVYDTYCKDDYLQKDLPRIHLWEIYGQGTNFPRVDFLDILKLLEYFVNWMFMKSREVFKWMFMKWMFLEINVLLLKSVSEKMLLTQ